jgi:TonB family protein
MIVGWKGRTPGCVILIVALCFGGTACSERARLGRWGREAPPDEVPQVLNDDLPFRYPTREFAMRVQGNVTLRLFIDLRGRVVPESSTDAASSGNVALDSSALAGAGQLRFRPAHRDGVPIPVAILFPVQFRHPAGLPLPGDTISPVKHPSRPGP